MVRELSAEDRMALGQHFIVGFQGPTLTDDFKKFIQEFHIGGVIYFKNNYENPNQIAELSNELQKLIKPKSWMKLPLFISTDHEGGRVQRFLEPFTKLPPLAAIGKKNSPTFAFDYAEAIAKELAAVGVNTNFSPVLDLADPRPDQAIGDRSISTDPEIVAKLGSAMVRGFQKGGVMAVAKHFPGHGLTQVDSHAKLPVVDKNLSDIEANALMPFKRALRARCDGVMVAHLKFPKVDPDFPCTLSKVWQQDVLRTQMRYQKLIFSDDMEMGAMTELLPPTEAALRALQAGTDVLIYKGSDLNAMSVIMTHLIRALEKDDWPRVTFTASNERILAIKRDEEYKMGTIVEATQIKDIVGCTEHWNLIKSI